MLGCIDTKAHRDQNATNFGEAAPDIAEDRIFIEVACLTELPYSRHPQHDNDPNERNDAADPP